MIDIINATRWKLLQYLPFIFFTQIDIIQGFYLCKAKRGFGMLELYVNKSLN